MLLCLLHVLICTQSLKGKNASLATLRPFKSNLNCFDFSIACRNASMRLVCPQPLPISCLFFIKAIALLFKCLQTIFAKTKIIMFCLRLYLFRRLLSIQHNCLYQYPEQCSVKYRFILSFRFYDFVF